MVGLKKFNFFFIKFGDWSYKLIVILLYLVFYLVSLEFMEIDLVRGYIYSVKEWEMR